MEAKWQELFEHKESWVDQRGSKQGRQPDFKARSDRTRALWLDSRGLPSWVPERVSEEFGVSLQGHSRVATLVGLMAGWVSRMCWQVLCAFPAGSSSSELKVGMHPQACQVSRMCLQDLCARSQQLRGVPPVISSCPLQEPVAGQPVQAHSGQPQSAETDFSQLLAGGPAAYYDNRVGKRNPLSPDFKCAP